MRSNEINHVYWAIYEQHLYVFTLDLWNFCMKKCVIQPFKLLYPSIYPTYLPILTRDKRLNTPSFSALWLYLALGSGGVDSPYL